MTLYSKNGNPLGVGDIVTYDIHDETATLAMLKPMPPYLKNSCLVIGEYKGNLELRWRYGNSLEYSNTIKLDAETANALQIVLSFTPEGDSNVD